MCRSGASAVYRRWMPAGSRPGPGVRSAVRGQDGNPARIEVMADTVEPVLRRMLAEDAGLSDLDVQRAGLADAFIELTRDDAGKEAA